MSRRTCLFPALTLVLLAGCGGATSPPEGPQGGAEAAGPRRAGSAPSVESEIGAMDEERTQKTFERLARTLARCIETGAKRIPYLGGDVRLAVRVASDGTARWTYVKDSTLGDRETEECMLRVMKSTAWPKPVGGEGLAENLFTFEPNPDERPPVDWSPSQTDKALRDSRDELSTCRKEAGTGPLKATLYVDPDGKPLSVGVSGSDERAEAAARCVADTLRKLTFPSPGSYDAKVSITID